MTLTVQAEAIANGSNFGIEVGGTLNVAGTANNCAQLNALRIKFLQSVAGEISIDRAFFNGGSFMDRAVQGGDISLSNSVVEGWGDYSGYNSYLFYGRSTDISGNIFRNSVGFTVYGGSDVNIQDNVFASTAGITVYSGSSPRIFGNSFLNGTAITAADGNFVVNAEVNWFGTTSSHLIALKINDNNDDLNRGKVDFSPFLSKASATSPAYGTADGDVLVGKTSQNFLFGYDGNESETSALTSYLANEATIYWTANMAPTFWMAGKAATSILSTMLRTLSTNCMSMSGTLTTSMLPQATSCRNG